MDRFLIAPLATGLETDLKPWMIPDDAFSELRNAYVFRGRVRKRFGTVGSALAGVTQLDSRLALTINNVVGQGITSGIGNATFTIPGLVWKIGQMFQIGNALYTVITAGVTQTMLATIVTPTATFDTTNGTYNFVGAPANESIYFYPSEPVMGLTQYEYGAVNTWPSYAFDTQFAYTFVNNEWIRSGTVEWNGQLAGSNANFFWAANWTGLQNNTKALFVTNFQVTNQDGLGVVTDDPIWSMTKIAGTDTWVPFTYLPDAVLNPGNTQPYTVTQATAVTGAIITNFVQQARLIIPFKNRLLLLNTIENNANGAIAVTGMTPITYATSTNTHYGNRCRFSHFGNPFSLNAWLETNQVYNPSGAAVLQADGGGFIDAATDESIVGAEFIKDRLIVYFDESTWEIAYTGNQVEPFTWQKINTELGSQSTFSTIPFDKTIVAIGNTGVHACNGTNVERIDNKIPDNIFQIRQENSGRKRIVGIRDYFAELAYWTIPAESATVNTRTFPNEVLVYNYKNDSWAINDDTFTAFGYFDLEPDVQGGAGVNDRQIIAGNQQGFILIVSSELPFNAESLYITNIGIGIPATPTLTIINHNLQVGDYIALSNIGGTTGLNGNIYMVTASNPDVVTIGPVDPVATTAYTGGGNATRVSNINITSKQWNPYVNKGRNLYLGKIDFCVKKTVNGQVQVEYYPSSSTLPMVTAAVATGTILGQTQIPNVNLALQNVYNVLETKPYPVDLGTGLEATQARLWHSIYFQTQGEFIQIKISMSDAQIRTPNISMSEFEMEGLILFTQATTDRLQ